MSFEVSGHWRNQWDPVERIYRRRWVEFYRKGESTMGVRILYDSEAERAVLYDSVTERPIDHEAFMGVDAHDQAEHFLRWLENQSTGAEVPDVRAMTPHQLTRFLDTWHVGNFDDDGNFNPKGE